MYRQEVNSHHFKVFSIKKHLLFYAENNTKITLQLFKKLKNRNQLRIRGLKLH